LVDADADVAGAALAYANGAAACFAKPITAPELAIADLRAQKLELAVA
jgi:hypothetical protein